MGHPDFYGLVKGAPPAQDHSSITFNWKRKVFDWFSLLVRLVNMGGFLQ
jgi:hypothetical protein